LFRSDPPPPQHFVLVANATTAARGLCFRTVFVGATGDDLALGAVNVIRGFGRNLGADTVFIAGGETRTWRSKHPESRRDDGDQPARSSRHQHVANTEDRVGQFDSPFCCPSYCWASSAGSSPSVAASSSANDCSACWTMVWRICSSSWLMFFTWSRKASTSRTMSA